MNYRKTLLSASIVAALCLAGSAWAQSSTTDAGQAQNGQTPNGKKSDRQKPQQMGTVTVTGIRASLEQSLQTKRNADSIVDAITAEDIGKFPDTNVAESLAHVPGVTIDRQFGEGARVSINGVDPSLNLTLLNGEPIATLDYLYGAQPNRGFDYTVLPSQIVGKLEVYKTPQAKLPAGSIGGTVILHTRNPLDMKANLISGSIGYNYNDQANGGKPDASIVYSWKNAASDFGVAVSAQHFEEEIDRQGIEVFSYNTASQFAASSPAVAAAIASGKLSPNDKSPSEVNAAWFQQTRKRNSATLALQYKLTDHLELDFNGLYIKENFDNWNQSLYPIPTFTPGNIDSVTASRNGIFGGHVCGSDDPGCPAIARSILDSNIRRSSVKTTSFNLKGKYYADHWHAVAQAGYTKATDPSSDQIFIEPNYTGGYTYDLNKGVNFDSPQAARNPANWSTAAADGGFAGNYGKIPSSSKETYGQLDFGVDFNSFVNEIEFGVRYTDHTEDHTQHVYQGVSEGTLATIGSGGYTDLFGNLGRTAAPISRITSRPARVARRHGCSAVR